MRVLRRAVFIQYQQCAKTCHSKQDWDILSNGQHMKCLYGIGAVAKLWIEAV